MATLKDIFKTVAEEYNLSVDSQEKIRKAMIKEQEVMAEELSHRDAYPTTLYDGDYPPFGTKVSDILPVDSDSFRNRG